MSSIAVVLAPSHRRHAGGYDLAAGSARRRAGHDRLAAVRLTLVSRVLTRANGDVSWPDLLWHLVDGQAEAIGFSRRVWACGTTPRSPAAKLTRRCSGCSTLLGDCSFGRGPGRVAVRRRRWSGRRRRGLPARRCCVPLAPAKTLLTRLPDALAELLSAHRAPAPLIEAEHVEALEHRSAPPTNRSLVGVMNEFAFLTDLHRAEQPT
jgi:hypothetical protein